MTLARMYNVLLIGTALLLLAALFSLYRSPLFEIYLATWMLC